MVTVSKIRNIEITTIDGYRIEIFADFFKLKIFDVISL